MVKFERDNNYDHGKAGIVKMKDIRGTKESRLYNQLINKVDKLFIFCSEH